MMTYALTEQQIALDWASFLEPGLIALALTLVVTAVVTLVLHPVISCLVQLFICTVVICLPPRELLLQQAAYRMSGGINKEHIPCISYYVTYKILYKWLGFFWQ